MDQVIKTCSDHFSSFDILAFLEVNENRYPCNGYILVQEWQQPSLSLAYSQGYTLPKPVKLSQIQKSMQIVSLH